MSKTYERVLKSIKPVEPHGHCEAVKNRHIQNLKIAEREIREKLGK